MIFLKYVNTYCFQFSETKVIMEIQKECEEQRVLAGLKLLIIQIINFKVEPEKECEGYSILIVLKLLITEVTNFVLILNSDSIVFQ